jgi:preprotein translocase subunit SecY
VYLTPKSGLFLGGACVAAIAAVGSVFELSYGEPDFGVSTTAIILALSIPLTIFFFIAAVKDARDNME